MTSHAELIARAEASLDGVTDGPWDAALERGRNGIIAQSMPEGGANFVALVGNDEATPEKEPSRFANARFIAASRQNVPDLIAALKASEARVDELEAEVKRLRGALEPFSEMAGEMFANNWNENGVAVSLVTKDGRITLTFKEFRAARAALKGGDA